MKTRNVQKLVLTLTAVIAVTLLAAKAVAQDSSASTTAAATSLSYGVSQVVQLAHANIGEDVIVNYIRNSGNAYGLDATQILYLKQQGVSDRIINTMLNQRSQVAATAQTAPQPNSSGANSSQTAPAPAQPSVSYVQTAPAQTVYVIPDTQTYDYNAYYYQPYYYQPYYGGYYAWPAVSLSFGLGGYYGGGYHGGGGGFHGGGGHH